MGLYLNVGLTHFYSSSNFERLYALLNFSCFNYFENDTVPEIVNHSEMGVSFKAWLERNPNQKLNNPGDEDALCLRLWWNRNFYPHVDMIINDLHSKGLLEAGEYDIKIDW